MSLLPRFWLGGKVFVKEDAVGAFAHVQILLPFELAQSVSGDFEAWKRFVQNEILAQDEYQ